ncbi:hypothetical protein ACE01N_20215 [Saccharicrinis sp. FJH2]|uniref:hypothetical protein n=1 Tax=Saccharicrinis sp. FJH65 TaxID=3344659 RepID=UPI0035F27ED8
MKNKISSLIIILTLFCCNYQVTKSQNAKQINPEVTISNINHEQTELEHTIKVDKVYIGMTIDELKNIYSNSEFIEEPVYEFGIDGESNGLVIKQENERLFFVWTLQGENKIHGITIISNSLTIDQNVHVGMSLKEFHNKYPNLKVNIDMTDNRYEYLYVPELNYRVEFLTTDTTRIAEYKFDQVEPEFKRIKRPYATVDRISIK